MILKIAYDDNSEKVVSEIRYMLREFPMIELEAYHEQLFRERKKAFAIKNEWGTRMAPFAILIDNDKNPVIAFYSEKKECTADNIAKSLKNIIIYGSKSDQ
jgi:hypothetical protein